ncbi:MAG: DUF1737 domain-containing protein [Thermodesulfovibrionales bacterium]
MEYRILLAYNSADLEKQVNDLLNQGWRPQGGLCLTSGNYYVQAMIKD